MLIIRKEKYRIKKTKISIHILCGMIFQTSKKKEMIINFFAVVMTSFYYTHGKMEFHEYLGFIY